VPGFGLGRIKATLPMWRHQSDRCGGYKLAGLLALVCEELAQALWGWPSAALDFGGVWL
jgi:hypothetical protein